MHRRAFLRQLAASSAALYGATLWSACSHPPSRKEVLAALVQDVVVPDVRALAKESQALEVSATAFARAPSQAGLDALQAQWKRCLLAWKKGFAFRAGPIVESNALLRTMFWPVRSREIDSLIGGAQAITDSFVEQLGVDLKGLFALEHLLFDPPQAGQGPLERFMGSGGARASEYAVALAKNVNAYADDMQAALGDGAAFARSFSESTEQNLNSLVNQMVSTVETVAVQRLGFTLELLKNQRLSSDSLEGGKSGLSTQISETLLATTERLYLGVNGHGLAALTKQASEPIEARVGAAFEGARKTLAALGAPLEQAATKTLGKLEGAAAAARELEIALKVDLVSALGVTLTFTLGDGD
ncbi:MAG: imelysin family protein [Myxococcales bacterium]